MADYAITRRIEIDAAHRVALHGSKCANLHGHRYVIEATVAGPLVEDGEESGMVMDFGFLKEEMVAVIHDPCDHGTILWYHDPVLERLGGKWITDKLVLVPFHPTAENLAHHWYSELRSRIEVRTDGRADLAHVIVRETPNCAAQFPLSR